MKVTTIIKAILAVILVLEVLGCSQTGEQIPSDQVTSDEPVQTLRSPVTFTRGTFSDSRDGQTYKTVDYGGAGTWMAQNLNFEVPGSVFYANDSGNEATYGRLYTFHQAREACPKGWHLPTEAEWKKLVGVFLGESKAYAFLTNGEASGFNALLGGIYDKPNNEFKELHKQGLYWTDTEKDKANATCYNFSKDLGRTYSLNEIKQLSFSCRCIEGDPIAKAPGRNKNPDAGLRDTASSQKPSIIPSQRSQKIAGKIQLKVRDEPSHSFRPLRMREGKNGDKSLDIILSDRATQKQYAQLIMFESVESYSYDAAYQLQIDGNSWVYVFSIDKDYVPYDLKVHEAENTPTIQPYEPNTRISGDVIISIGSGEPDKNIAKIVLLSREKIVDASTILHQWQNLDHTKDLPEALGTLLDQRLASERESEVELKNSNTVAFQLGKEGPPILPIAFFINRQ